MPFQIIPWRNLPDFRQTIRLSGRVYILRARWNTSAEYWTIDIFDNDSRPVLMGQKIVLNTDILARYTDDRLPPGRLFPIDTSSIAQVSGAGEVAARIGRDDIGTSVFVVYEEP